MNRYVITKAHIKGQEYRISALYDSNRKMIEVLPELQTEGAAPILGNIYIGRVENVVKNLNAAFIKISSDQNCYLSFDDLKNPIFTRKLSSKKTLAAGDELLVQVSREALKTKEPAVTTNLSLAGKYAVLTSGNRKLSVSGKLTKDRKKHYQALLKENELQQEQQEKNTTTQSYGIIVRTNAAEASDDLVLAEIAKLRQAYEKIIETAQYKTCYSLLYEEEAACLGHLNNLRQDLLDEIVTDDRTLFEEICTRYQIPAQKLVTTGSVSVPVNEAMTQNGIKLRYHEDKTISLSALYGITTDLEDAIKERVWLKSGAYLIIQPTEALTVIDVNTGKNIAKREIQENFLKVNKEAAVEIARQLRLRNISGMIIVDFMNLTSQEAEADLLCTLRAELKKDPIPTQLIDITKLGLVEITRKKVRKSLREMIN